VGDDSVYEVFRAKLPRRKTMIKVILEVQPEPDKAKVVMKFLNKYREVKEIGYYSGLSHGVVIANMNFASVEAAVKWKESVLGSGSLILSRASKIQMRFNLDDIKREQKSS
jgi:hypothetical protein